MLGFIDWQPSIDVFTLGGFALHWYSALWCIGLLGAYIMVQKLYEQQRIPDEKFQPLFLYCFVGILVGARLGHCVFYEPQYFLTSLKGIVEMILPIHFIGDTWSFKFTGYAGLASHGGTIGLFLGMLYYSRKHDVRMWTVIDNVAIATPFTACCIRLGNLMNSEIIGTQTDMPWGFIFHSRDALVNGELVPRHPAQLYEAMAYLVFLFLGYYIYRKTDAPKLAPLNGDSNKKSGSAVFTAKGKNAAADSLEHFSRKSKLLPGFKVGTGFYFGFCLATIFTFRFFVEFLKKEQVDFEQGMMLDMGQLLSIPFVLIGAYYMLRPRKYNA